MHTNAILTLAQWLSPAFPVGSFAYSHGLEWAVENGAVRDQAGLQAWLETVLRHGTGLSDALFLAAAYRCDDPTVIDASARAFCASSERLKETVLQGEAFARASRDIFALDLPGLCYPVAFGYGAGKAGFPLELTLQMYLQAMISNLAAAGMRLIPLGQTEGQIVIKNLTALCVEIAQLGGEGSLSDLSSIAFLSDVASMNHETQYSRIFRT